MRGRKGFTLIELLVAITIASVVLGMCATFLTLMLRAEATTTQAFAEEASLSQLSRQFRDDAHLSLKAGLPADSSALQFSTSDGGQISYRATGQFVTRSEQHQESKTARKFPIWGANVVFEAPAEGGLVSMSITRRDPKPAGRVQKPAVRIEAAVGRDTRLADPSLK